MLLLLIQKEILEQLLSLRFAISCILCFVVMLTSVFVLTRDFRDDALDYHTDVTMHRNQVLGYEYPWSLGSDGIQIDKPLNPLRIFIKGIARSNTTTVRVTSWRAPEYESAAQRNPVIPLFPAIDLVFFVSIIMSLLAMAFSYDAISGEKEQGTLRLVMSYSVPRDLVLLGKWIGGYLALVGPFVISLLAGLSLVMLFPEAHLSGPEWARLAVIFLVALLCVSAVYSLGVLVSARTRMASTSITVLLLIWVLLALVIPNLSPYVASQIAPTRSMQSVEKEKANIDQEEGTKVQKEFEEWRAQKEKDGSLDWNSEEVTQYIRELREDYQARVAKRQNDLAEHFDRSLQHQVGLAQNISRASPTSSFVYAATEISGTGARERDHFRRQLERYRQDWAKYVEDKIGQYRAQQRASGVGGEGQSFDPSDYPRFPYEPPSLRSQLSGALLDLLLLGVWNVLFFLLAYLSFLRYDVR